MPPFIENMGTGTATCIVIAAVAAYAVLTIALLKKNPRKLWIPAIVILFIATVFYYRVYDYAVARTWFPKLFMALVSALDLFLFKMTSGIGNLSSFFYLKDGIAAPGVQNPQVHLILLQGLYICAIWTTSILVVHFLAGRLVSKGWLLFNSGKSGAGRTHIFLGTSRQSVALAKSLPAGERVIFVEEPAGEALPDKVSILGLFRGVKSDSAVLEKLRGEIPGAVLLKAKKSIRKCTDGKLFEELGLKRLARWAQNERNCFYLLSDKFEDNLSALRRMQPVKAQVYYHAKREGAAQRMDLASPENIHIVDSSFLATKALKTNDKLYPIHLVEIGRDGNGDPAGYVTSPFNALIVGFGEGGRGALSFLYEFGTFVGKDGKASPFHCDVVDADMDKLAADYLETHPSLNAGKVNFIQCRSDSEQFREILRKRIGALNYVFISIGSDSANVGLAIETLESAFKYRQDLDKLLIVTKVDKPADYRGMIHFYNVNYGGREIIHSIGDVDGTWRWANVSGEEYLGFARQFQEAYSASSPDGVSWDERYEQIRRKPGTELSHRMELRRKNGQDFANWFHVRVKAALCPARLWSDTSVADSIPVSYDGKHYTGDDPQAASVLGYLAIQEHLRWMASHEAAGYRYGDEKREDLMTHPDMRSYEQLDEHTRHYDWVVVKTSLLLLHDMVQPRVEG